MTYYCHYYYSCRCMYVLFLIQMVDELRSKVWTGLYMAYGHYWQTCNAYSLQHVTRAGQANSHTFLYIGELCYLSKGLHREERAYDVRNKETSLEKPPYTFHTSNAYEITVQEGVVTVQVLMHVKN